MNPLPERKSPRLPDYDYSHSGAYFITICAHNRLHRFGHIRDDEMDLNVAGTIAADCWLVIPDHYPDVELDQFVIMPNHMHGILFLHGESAGLKTFVGRVINAYKGAVTTRIRQTESSNLIVWQPRYHDHVIRNDSDLRRIREYVLHNPARWNQDRYFT